MKTCDQCYCYTICRIVYGAVLERFSKSGTLDDLENLWQELALRCKYYWQEKRKMETGEAKYCGKCYKMIKTIGKTCPQCGRALYHIY